MSQEQPNNPLHSITLEMIVTQLVDHYGWEELGTITKINFFKLNPKINPALTFLRKTPWAREKVESFYMWFIKQK